MSLRHLFLLVYLSASCWGTLYTNRNGTCITKDTCVQGCDPTCRFLQCVGLPSSDTGKEHLLRLKGIVEAALDIYTFMRSSLKGVPFLELQAAMELNPVTEAYQDQDLVKMWFSVKIRPLLRSITKHFLTCLSTKNFSCATYQTMVKELSVHFSEMDPVRQKWIYTFFMYPFLSGEGIAGCVRPEESSEDWLMKNFGFFKAMARMKDFSQLNMDFSGLEVLHLLTPEQKAELLLRPEVSGLDNGTLSLVFHSLMTEGTGPGTTPVPGLPLVTGPPLDPGYPLVYSYGSHGPPLPHSSLSEVVSGFMGAFRPVGGLVSEFVSLTHKQDVSEIRSTTLIQLLLNWTLAETASLYRPQNTSLVLQDETFDVTDVEDWYTHVVMPILHRFLTPEHAQISDAIKLTFHKVFYLDSGMHNDTSDLHDTCSITLEISCGLTNAVEDAARVLHCMAQSNLTLSEDTVMRLVEEMTKRLITLVKEFSTENFSELVGHFREVFGQVDSPAMTEDNLEDPEFIKLWFKIKLLPLLPAVPTDLLSCLSTKNFTCSVYQALVAELSEHMRDMDPEQMYSHMIYTHFIYPFLVHHNSSDPQCVSSASDNAEWLGNNFGFFSMFAPLRDFYDLNPNFSGLEVLHLLTPRQTAELLVLPLPSPPEKDVIIPTVFDYLTGSPEDRRFTEVLHHAALLAEEVNPPCLVFRLIVGQLYEVLSYLPPKMEPSIYNHIDQFIQIAPTDCLPQNFTCPTTQSNGTEICTMVSSYELQHYLAMSDSMDVPCHFTLQEYACAELENFTAHQLASLLQCDLPSNSSHSRMAWKILLIKQSSVLDPALDILANMAMVMIGPSAREILDVIGELRVGLLSDEQLRDSDVIREWFSERLSGFLTSASGRFLHCLSNRNLSCQSYQQILQAFSHQFMHMTSQQQHLVVQELILPFLSRQEPDSCVSGLNSSEEWLEKNLGPFSVLLSLRDILYLNPAFMPLDALRLLSPKQTAELVVLPLSTVPQKEVIHTVFTYLAESPMERRFPEFLSHLVMFSEKENISCSTYEMIFTGLDHAIPVVPLHISAAIDHSKIVLFTHVPPGCIIYSGECPGVSANETNICANVNSTLLQLQLDQGKINQSICDFGIEDYACASLSALGAEDVAALLKCNRSHSAPASRPVWKLLFSKTSLVLDHALDLLSNMTFNPRDPATSDILDAIADVRLHTFPPASFQSPAFIHLWFGQRLRPFLSAVSMDTLSCLSTKNFSCSTYQTTVQAFSQQQPMMELPRQISVYIYFIRPFLTRNNTADSNCSNGTNSGEWLLKNFGRFSALISFHDLQMLNPDFSALEALPHLTVRQLSEVSSTPGQLSTPAQVSMVMAHVRDRDLAAFFDDFSPTIMGKESQFPSAVRSAMLQEVFDRANLSDHRVSDAEVLVWLDNRLSPLLVELSPYHVAPFFRVVAGRNCSTEQEAVRILNSTLSTLNEDTQKEIHDHIIRSLRDPTPLRCYGDNYNNSFYGFLNSRFLEFQFPNLTTFLSLMPESQMHQLVNSMPPSDLGDFLRRPDTLDDNAKLCHIYNIYTQTPLFLETEKLPEMVRRHTLPCIWPVALKSSRRSEVNAWFDRRLPDYLVFLTKDLLTSTATQNASCLAFQKLVSTMENYDFATSDFVEQDVYGVIKTYLASETVPQCYDATDPQLNSTAWFAEYIGAFMTFLTLDDLNTFGSAEVIQVFTVNHLNLALLSQSMLPLNLTNYYTQLIYQQDTNFNPLLLPLLNRCVAPGAAFSQLDADQSMTILHNLTTHCPDLDPQISAALAANFGDNLNADAIAALGNESTSISTGQINMANPEDLYVSLGMLSSTSGWSYGQAAAIVNSLMTSGLLQINSSASLVMLGSLVGGVPASVFSSINGTQLIAFSKEPSFLTHFMSVPQIIQQTFVTQIVAVDSNSEKIIGNVPDELATEIPAVLLVFNSLTVVDKLNKKRWKREQAVLFFDKVAVGMENQEKNISSFILQGFTCTSVATLSSTKVTRLIKACRRRGRQRVDLQETQLTCMFNYVKEEADATNFTLYPPDVLLYYDYSLVPQATCRSYFEELSDADFSVFSDALNYKLSTLFTNAKSCLNITANGLSEDNIRILGNMVCTLDRSYIQNSDPFILEILKNCKDFTDDQVNAMETLLMTGTTTYGAPATWNGQTLNDLGILPLYLTITFYEQFDKRTKRRFLKTFLETLNENKVNRRKIGKMKKAIRESNTRRSRRSTNIECTEGQITQITISEETFPFDYTNVAQFNSCLNAETVKDNLAAIIAKVDDEDFLRIILDKLREAYASTSSIPEEQVQVLGPASRLATNEDISMWTITKIDTLSALMDVSEGEWNQALAEAIISKYLRQQGNSLGSAELNSIGGVNLCALDISVIRNISENSIRNANALQVSNCTIERKRVLFTIAQAAFSSNTRSTVSATEYQLMQSYLGGANLNYVRSLAGSNINMDMATFTSLDEEVVLTLSVNEVRGVLGSNLPELKSYENNTLVASWIGGQLQSELDRLGLGLVGRADPTASGGSTVTVNTGASVSSTTSSSSPAPSPPSSSSPVPAPAPSSSSPAPSSPAPSPPSSSSPVPAPAPSSSSPSPASSSPSPVPAPSSSSPAPSSSSPAPSSSSPSPAPSASSSSPTPTTGNSGGAGSTNAPGASGTTTGNGGVRTKTDTGLYVLLILIVISLQKILFV